MEKDERRKGLPKARPSDWGTWLWSPPTFLERTAKRGAGPEGGCGRTSGFCDTLGFGERRTWVWVHVPCPLIPRVTSLFCPSTPDLAGAHGETWVRPGRTGGDTGGCVRPCSAIPLVTTVLKPSGGSVFPAFVPASAVGSAVAPEGRPWIQAGRECRFRFWAGMRWDPCGTGKRQPASPNCAASFSVFSPEGQMTLV